MVHGLYTISHLSLQEMQETITTYEQFYVHMYGKQEKGAGNGNLFLIL